MQTIIDNQLINYKYLKEYTNEQTILILHGWGRNLNDWTQVGQALSLDKNVILVDLPGFGESSFPINQPFDTFDYAEIINKFIEKLKLKNIILIGHSFGGKISMIIASKNNLIKKLILIDASGVEKKTSIIKLKYFIYKLLKPISTLTPPFIRSKIFSIFASSDYRNAGKLKESFKKIVNQDVSDYAHTIKIPTLIVWGDNDKEVSLEAAKKLKSLIPHSILRIVWGVGHDPHLEKKDRLLEIIEQYI